MRVTSSVAAFLLSVAPAAAQELYVRVVDVGNGLCVIAQAPGGETLLYDAGHSGTFCPDNVRALIGSRPLEMMVLSHSDEDHISEAQGILATNGARLIMHPGDDRSNTIIDPLRQEISRAQSQRGSRVVSMATNRPEFGQTYALGEAQVRFVAGWSDGAETAQAGDPSLPPSDRHNALSIVIRLEYGGHSILLTGDIIGRRRNERTSIGNRACRNAERIIAAGAMPVRSDVLIGQHHGGNNSTSNCFIRAVAPTWVVFSAGRGHGHPTQAVADRLTAEGPFRVPPERILRTDRGDHEANEPGHWNYGSFRGCRDEAGDDDVEIWLPRDPSQAVRVQYRWPASGCSATRLPRN
jgi:competence protein ComEC